MKRAPHKLAAWQRSNGFTDADAGAHFGTTRMTWIRWKAGDMIPGPAFMIELYRETEGEVQPNDFYDLPILAPMKVAA